MLVDPYRRVTVRPVGRRFRLDLNEISGSIGDLATFLPLAIGLISINGVNATSLFLSTGLAYIAAGLYYGLPMPVQPLKATSAIAIALAVGPDAVSAAAFWMGVIFILLSLFDLRGIFGRIFTRPIVRGIQLGLGVLLVKGGGKAIFRGSDPAIAGMASSPVLYAVALAIGSAGILLLSRKSRRYPAALAVTIFGLLCGLLASSSGALSSPAMGWIAPKWGVPADADLYTVLVVLLLPQIPLTFANSVVATAETSRQYFGEGARRVTIRSLSASLGFANLFAGLIGGMPVCHGSGGLTAHYRFGARGGGANLFIGGLFVALALLFGRSIPEIFGLLPSPVLGVLLVYVGFEHARLIRDVLEVSHELAVALSIGIMTLLTGNLGIAFMTGIVLNAIGGKLLKPMIQGDSPR
ncbi:MAG: putative sulfate/molybdate transporter [Deltaproteobacteria bacterium]|nr:putative sulfate/molybdate transporter [Deltaproteobacteria bacterium]